MKELTKEQKNKGRTRCAVWARSVGYLRPTINFNEGKLAEFKDRKMFKVK
jgi:anaerobic ribonucleoside-triphosphate reductase